MARETVDLAAAPGTLGLYRRAVLQRAKGGDRVPEKVLRLTGQVPDADRVAAYAAVVGERLSSVLPPLFPHLLGFPLQMALMTDPRSPFPAMGLVHVLNSVTVLAPIPLGAAMDVEVEMSEPRPHRKGRTVDLVARVGVDGEILWRSSSTYLRRGKGSDDAVPGLVVPEGTYGPANAVWTLPAGLGRDYAAVSGDRNPIHLSALSAKAFGFPRAIAHGMWTAARALAALEGRLPEHYRNDIEFKAPILLPGTVEFLTTGGARETRLQVRDRKGRAHLNGTVTAL
jgi:acyl dehydratase